MVMIMMMIMSFILSYERCCLSYYHYIGRDPTATKKFTTGTFEALFPQNSNSKFGRGSAQILNLNFAAPQLFRAPPANCSPPGAAKILWPGCGKVAARATLSLKVARFLNYVLCYRFFLFLIKRKTIKITYFLIY